MRTNLLKISESWRPAGDDTSVSEGSLTKAGAAPQLRRTTPNAIPKVISRLATTRITALLQDALSQGAERGEFNGDPEAAALHITTVARGLAVLERAFGDEDQLRKIAKNTIDLVLGKESR